MAPGADGHGRAGGQQSGEQAVGHAHRHLLAPGQLPGHRLGQTFGDGPLAAEEPAGPPGRQGADPEADRLHPRAELLDHLEHPGEGPHLVPPFALVDQRRAPDHDQPVHRRQPGPGSATSPPAVGNHNGCRTARPPERRAVARTTVRRPWR